MAKEFTYGDLLIQLQSLLIFNPQAAKQPVVVNQYLWDTGETRIIKPLSIEDNSLDGIVIKAIYY